MKDPRLEKISAFQPADDNRPFDEWVKEQIDIGRTITGGEKTIDEYFRDRARRKKAKAIEADQVSATAA